MPTPVTMPDGAVVLMPDNPTPEQLSQLAQIQGKQPQGAAENLWAAAKDLGYSGLAGLVKNFSVLPQAVQKVEGGATDISNYLRKLLGKPPQRNPIADAAGRLAGQVQETGGAIGDKSRLTGYPKAMVEGAGSASMNPGNMLANLFVGSLAGGGAEAGGQLTDNHPLGRTLGGIVGGLGGGLLTSLDKPSTAANRELARNARAIPAQDWAAAAENLQKMQRSGSSTGTLAEAFPGRNPLLPMAEEARRVVPDGSLAARVAGREQDLQNLGQTALNRVGPAQSQEAVTQQAIAAANARLQQIKDLRSGVYEQAKNSPAFGPNDQIPPQVAELAHQYLMGKAAAANTQIDKDAYQAVASSFLTPRTASVPQPPVTTLGTVGEKGFKVQQQVPQPDLTVPVPKTSPFDVSKDLKQIQTELRPLGANATGGQALDRAAVGRAYGEAQDILKTASPRYRTAEDRFREISEGLYNPMRAGPIGQLAGRTARPEQNPLPNATRLGQLVQDQSPSDILGTPQNMGTAQHLAAGAPDNPNLIRDIARVLMERKIEKGSTNPGQAIRGAEGSLDDQRVRALLQAAGVNPQRATEPLSVADMLQPLNTPAGSIPNPATTALGTVARPFTTIARLANTEGYRNMQETIGRLLANPTPANLAELQRIAQQNPQLRDLLTGMASGAYKGAVVGETSK